MFLLAQKLLPGATGADRMKWVKEKIGEFTPSNLHGIEEAFIDEIYTEFQPMWDKVDPQNQQK